MLIKNKKGDNRYLTIWNFLMWAITGAALAVVILMFYSLKIDVREDEAKILALKLIDCIIDSGEYNQEFSPKDYNIFNECGINEKIMSNGNYYFKVLVYEVENQNKNLIKETDVGTRKYAKECELAKTMKGDFPSCFEETFVAYDKSKKFEIIILTASSQAGAKI